MSAHSASAKQKGASEAQIASLGDFEAGPFTHREKLGFRFADRLHRSAREIDDDFYASLQDRFSDREIIELAAVAAAYEFFTRFVDSLKIPTTPLPPDPIARE
jgi:alkylhydroperoxidase family enzyme